MEGVERQMMMTRVRRDRGQRVPAKTMEIMDIVCMMPTFQMTSSGDNTQI